MFPPDRYRTSAAGHLRTAISKKSDSSPMSVLGFKFAGCWDFFISLICFPEMSVPRWLF